MAEQATSKFIESFFANKIKDGEKIEDWALWGILYQEAVQLLRQGKLYYEANNPLQGQKKTAEKITQWVEGEFLKRSTIQSLQERDTVHNNAMIGFLYKEAVELLRKGQFNALGAENTADTIDRYVQQRFFKRLNINF